MASLAHCIAPPSIAVSSAPISQTAASMTMTGRRQPLSGECVLPSASSSESLACPPTHEDQIYRHDIDIIRSDEHADIFAQWDALVERENSEAYLLPRLFGDEHAAPTHEIKSREELCMWCYHVTDEYDLDRAIVALALSYFDSLCTQDLILKSEWPLALMTSLYLAIKVASYNGKIFSPALIAKFSRGLFKSEDILRMEKRICEGFDWYLNPPVADGYLNVLTPLLLSELPTIAAPIKNEDCAIDNMAIDIDINIYNQCNQGQDQGQEDIRHHLIQQAKFLAERSVLDLFFSSKHPSSIVHATISVALELMHFPSSTIEWFASLPLDHDPEESEACAARLHAICSAEDYAPAVTIDAYAPAMTIVAEERAESPRTVTPIKADISNNNAPTPTKRMRSQDNVMVQSYFDSSSSSEDEEEGGIIVVSTKMRRVL